MPDKPAGDSLTPPDLPTRPPEAQLIRDLRIAPPEQSIKKAAARTAASDPDPEKKAISDTRWRDIENGYKYVGGVPQPVTDAPAQTVARMALAVGGIPSQFESVRPDVAGEMEALLLDVEISALSPKQKRLLGDLSKRAIDES